MDREPKHVHDSDPSEDMLAVANWDKLDSYLFHMLMDPDKFFSYSGSIEGFVREAMERQAFSGTASFLLRVSEESQDDWAETEVDGLQISSRTGNIFAATGNIDTIVALAKDDNVLSVDASRPVS